MFFWNWARNPLARLLQSASCGGLPVAVAEAVEIMEVDLSMKNHLKFACLLLVGCACLPFSSPAVAELPRSLLVLGVIASGVETSGVALVKTGNNSAFAARVGDEVDRGVVIQRITREFVYLRVNGRLERLKVGEQISGYDNVPKGLPADVGGVERQGNKVRVSAAYREHMVKHQLSAILMQAAAVPYYSANVLNGFRLLEIEAGSVFEKVGFVNGDLITAINGQRLTDVAMTIRLLQSLKDETKADVTLIRNNQEQSLQIVVE